MACIAFLTSRGMARPYVESPQSSTWCFVWKHTACHVIACITTTHGVESCLTSALFTAHPAKMCPSCRTASQRWRRDAVLRFLDGSYCHADAPCRERLRSGTGRSDDARDAVATGSDPSSLTSLSAVLAGVGLVALLGWWCCGHLGGARRRGRPALQPVNNVLPLDFGSKASLLAHESDPE
eukprot:3775813-Pleurochrysis_carterae.AAC.1